MTTQIKSFGSSVASQSTAPRISERAISRQIVSLTTTTSEMVEAVNDIPLLDSVLRNCFLSLSCTHTEAALGKIESSSNPRRAIISLFRPSDGIRGLNRLSHWILQGGHCKRLAAEIVLHELLCVPVDEKQGTRLPSSFLNSTEGPLFKAVENIRQLRLAVNKIIIAEVKKQEHHSVSQYATGISTMIHRELIRRLTSTYDGSAKRTMLTPSIEDGDSVKRLNRSLETVLDSLGLKPAKKSRMTKQELFEHEVKSQQSSETISTMFGQRGICSMDSYQSHCNPLDMFEDKKSATVDDLIDGAAAISDLRKLIGKLEENNPTGFNILMETLKAIRELGAELGPGTRTTKVNDPLSLIPAKAREIAVKRLGITKKTFDKHIRQMSLEAKSEPWTGLPKGLGKEYVNEALEVITNELGSTQGK